MEPGPAQSALAVVVPEAEFVVKPFRDRYDPSAALGVAAHITLLFPFKPPDEIDGVVLKNLQDCFRSFPKIRFRFSCVRRFPDTIYLAPDPDEPFRQLTLAIWKLYPETPPYGGRWPDIMPHLSVASHIVGESEFDRIDAEFATAARAALPIDATIAEVLLIENRSGLWRTYATFSLGHD